MLNIEQIAHAKGISNFKNIISINGMPFYRSLDTNDASCGTWLPFSYLFVYVYMKLKVPFLLSDRFPQEILNKFNKFYPPKKPNTEEGPHFTWPYNFENMPCMLISSWLGGGFWDKKEGKELKQYLQQQYPLFYKNAPKFHLLPVQQQFNDDQSGINNINNWLCQKANVTSTAALLHFVQQKPAKVEEIKNIQFTDGMIKLSSPKNINEKVTITLKIPPRKIVKPNIPRIKITGLETLQNQRLHQAPQDISRKTFNSVDKKKDNKPASSLIKNPKKVPKENENKKINEKPSSKVAPKNPNIALSLTSAASLKGLVFGALVGAGLWYGGIPLLFSGISALFTFGAHFSYQSRLLESKQSLKSNEKQWMTENGLAYDLGYQSKNWFPYMKSCLDPRAHWRPVAYEIGLEEAQEGKQQRKSPRC